MMSALAAYNTFMEKAFGRVAATWQQQTEQPRPFGAEWAGAEALLLNAMRLNRKPIAPGDRWSSGSTHISALDPGGGVDRSLPNLGSGVPGTAASN